MEEAAARWPGQVAVGLDARDGSARDRRLARANRTSKRSTSAIELRAAGVTDFIFTDICRDGTLKGPNLHALPNSTGTLGRGLIASGGVGSHRRYPRVTMLGVDGVIIGRALYDGRVELRGSARRANVGRARMKARR